VNGHDKHTYYLSNLERYIEQIGLERRNIDFILREPTRFYPHDNHMMTMCDMIIGVYGYQAIALELKGCKAKRHKAKQQIASGKEFIMKELNREYLHGLFVVYFHPKTYYVEIIG